SYQRERERGREREEDRGMVVWWVNLGSLFFCCPPSTSTSYLYPIISQPPASLSPLNTHTHGHTHTRTHTHTHALTNTHALTHTDTHTHTHTKVVCMLC